MILIGQQTEEVDKNWIKLAHAQLLKFFRSMNSTKERGREEKERGRVRRKIAGQKRKREGQRKKR